MSSPQVQHDLPCRNCGYNIRSLNVDQLCPECGHPISQTITGELWKQADPKWLANLILATRAIQTSLTTFIAIAILVWLLLTFWRPTYPIHNQIALLILTTTLDVFAIAASMWLFLREPADPATQDPNRKNAKTALAVSFALLAVALITLPFAGKQDPHQIASAVAALGYLAGIVSQIFQLEYLAAIARKIPDPALARRARFLKYALAVSLLLVGPLPEIAAAPLLFFAITYILTIGRLRDQLLIQLPLSKMREAIAAEPA